MRNRDFFKQKVVFFYGYNGRDYKGVQVQKPLVRSVENVVLAAFSELGMLRDENLAEIKKIKLSRAARTDKKVHALVNAMSIKIDVGQKFLRDEVEGRPVSKAEDKHRVDWLKLIHQINANLPKDIRFYCCKLVTKGFDVRHDTRSRTYVYLLPSFLFLSQARQPERTQTQAEAEGHLKELQELAGMYKGTHCFNNFTKGYKPSDKRCVRYVMAMGVELERIGDSLYYRFRLTGQSFIYHQIRKMVGFIVQLYFRDHTTAPTTIEQKKEALKKALREFGTEVFLAPGQGLYLESIDTSNYNRKRDIPEPLVFTEEEQARIQEFRKVLEAEMVAERPAFEQWLQAHFEGAADKEESDEGAHESQS